MKTIILDFTNCKYHAQLHEILKESFGFPEYYGANLDALWDCLRFYCDFELCVIIKGLDTMPKEFDEYIDKMLEVFEDVHCETPNIRFEIV